MRFTIIFIFVASNLFGQFHCCFDSLDFYLRNQVKKVTVITYQEKVIVNRVNLFFDKNSLTLTTCVSDKYSDSCLNSMKTDFKKMFDSVIELNYREIYLFDAHKRLIQKKQITNRMFPSTTIRTYFYSDSLSCRLKMITLEATTGNIIGYFYYDESGNTLVKNVSLHFQPDTNTETSCSTHLYEYYSNNTLKKEQVYKDNKLLCVREFSYEFYNH